MDKEIARKTGYQGVKAEFLQVQCAKLTVWKLHYASETLYHGADYSDAKPLSDS